VGSSNLPIKVGDRFRIIVIGEAGGSRSLHELEGKGLP
jgi:hypothetical protein